MECAADALLDGSLVRFCGMVQDVHDPEYYDGVYEEVDASGASRLCTTMYRGEIAPSRLGVRIEPRADFVWQRAPVVCAPMPSRSTPPW